VRYAEIDAMGVVHHATYLVYFEEARSQYMRDICIDYGDIEASGYSYLLVKLVRVSSAA
jgi:acyl-CoA thioester hydrolase